MNTHACIRLTCGKSYEDEDPDAYYCPDCQAQNKVIAAEIAAKLATRPRKERRSALQEYDASPKINGFVKATL